MPTNDNINYGPAPLPGTAPAPVLGNNIDRGPAAVPAGPATGSASAYIPPVSVVPVVERPVVISSARTDFIIPVTEQAVDINPVSTPAATPNATNQQRYITVLANGVVITNNATTLNFTGNGVSVSNLGTSGANIVISGSSGSNYSNSNVSALLAAFGSNTVLTTGNITGGYFIGNGSQLTGLPATYGNANVVANLAALGTNPVSTTGNVTAGNVLTSAEVIASGVIQTGTGFSTGGYLSVNGATDLHNTTVTGNLSATGNITGNYILGNGSQLTGLPATYGNANVVANLAALGTNPVSTTGNVTAGYFIGNGSTLTSIAGANVTGTVANATYALTSNAATYSTQATYAGTANAVAGANVSGTVANATYATSAGSATTAATVTTAAQGNITSVGTLTSLSTTGNITSGNLLTAGLITATGNITGNYFIGNGSQLTGISAGANTGNVTFRDEIVIGTGTSNLISGLYLAPSSSSANANMYLRVRGNIIDEPTHIHFDTGNNAYYNQFIGDDNKYIQLANTGNIVVNSNDSAGNSAQWTFGTDGNLTLPGNLVIAGNTSVFGTDAALIAPTDDLPLIALSSGANGSVSSLWAEDIGNVGASNIAAVYVNPTPGSKIVRIAVGQNGNAGPNLWDFDATGNLSAPGAISATGNITGNFFVGNGSLLTGIAAGYGNANVVANLAALGSNPVSTTGNITSGNLDLSYMGGAAKGNLTGGNISVTGNITGGNIITAGLLSTGGNVTGGNILTAGAVSASSTITGANLSTGGTVSATGNVTGGNIVTGGLITASGNITTPGNILNQGFVSSTGNAIHGNILTGGLVSAAGNITAGNVFSSATMSTGGNIFAALNISATGTVYGSNFNTTGLISAGGNVTVGNILTAGLISATSTITSAANITGGNVLTGGVISSTGNITGGNISATNHTGTTVSVTGNITGGNLLTGGLISAAGNITAGNIINTGISSVTGNITGGNIATAGQVSATGNITTANYFVGNLVGTSVSVTGNVSAGNVIVNGQPTTYGIVNTTVVANTSPVSSTNFNGGSSASPALTVMTVAIPSAGTWRLDAEMRVYIPGEGYMAAGFYDNGTLISGSEYFIAAGGVTQTGAATGQYGGFMSYNLTTAGATTVTMGAWATGTSQFITSADGRTWLQATLLNPSIAVQATATGTINNQYASITNNTDISITNGVAKDVTFDTVTASSGIPYNTSTGVFTLTSGVTYRFTGELSFAGYTGYALYQLVDATTNTPINNQTSANPSYNSGFAEANNNTYDAIYTPSTNQTVKFRVTGSSFTGTGVIRGGYYGRINVQQINNAFALNTLETMSLTGNITTSGNVSATGNVTGNYILGNGALLTGVITSVANINSGTSNVTVVSSGGNVTVGVGGTGNVAVFATTGEYITGVVSASGNVTGGNVLTAGLISATGNITGGNISATNHTGTTVSVSGNVTSGNVVTGGLVSATATVTGGNLATGGTASATGNINGGNVLTAGLISATGNITGGNISATNHTGTAVSITGNITAANFFGNGNTLSNVATRFESAWTVPVGNSTQSFTVAASETYYLWVDCNIPNGILVWNATATVTNTNVPVVGQQFAWVYNGGGTPIDFTSIPNQFTGTANAIVRSNVAPSSTTNRFDFGINNTSGGSVTVRYGWVAIS